MTCTLARGLGGLALLWALASCGPQSTPPPRDGTPPAAAPSSATVSYLSGTAETLVGGAWQALDIGSKVTQGSQVRTGPSSTCELQLGDLATVRLGGNTLITWEALALGVKGRRSQLQVLAGSVLNKVSKLLEGDSYVVRTSTASLGVRGTQFLVKVGQASSQLAVKEGVVAVLPASFDPAAWSQAGDSPAAQALEHQLLEASQGVAAGQKLSIALKDLDAADRALQAAGTALPADPQALLDAYRQATSPRPVAPLAPSDVLELKPLDTMPLGDVVPVAQVQAAPAPTAPAAPPTPPSGPRSRVVTLTGATTVAAAVATTSGLVVFDGETTLRSYGAQGGLQWSASVPSVSNASTTPLVDASEVVWTGDNQVATYDLRTGKLKVSIALDALTSGVAAKRALPLGNRLVLGASDGLAVFDRSTGAPSPHWAFAEGTDMTPALAGGLVYVVGRAGTVLGFDAAKGSVVLQVATGANQPAAMAPTVVGEALWFADRKGLVVAVSLAKSAVLWKVNLGAAVFDQPVHAGSAVYVWAQGRVHALSATTGSALFAPVESLVPPLVVDARLFVAASGQARVLDAATGQELWAHDTPSEAATAALVWGAEVAYPLQDGRVLVVDPKTLPGQN